ncbi:LuxR C-terminal-related transcriptional regulator [Streptosporangium sp. 'caverna']|uniref:LuxR C-terminal-related transcriptional regulator n=1 Tax=Streptosporangium sp. 'caverna' TaxID=2202249 RepID=UPI000D7DDB58|nr:LuxR C-terminal-related transcriptional regulator [Streptosporangium sp. 'caverna']AWS46331.1 helix-turn-helix transcriptional regulator [Streptosporangium sp. 'caverna']
MARPVIATKLYVPKLRPGLVARPRLRERLRRGAESRLTLVSAPAGFGKTTLLAEWLDERAGEDHSVAWLSLDLEDGDPASFWTCVVTALHTAVPGVSPSALELAASSPLPAEHLLATLLNELAAAPGEIWLVLDDYHLVDNHDVSAGVVFFLEHLPPHVHVVLSTRADPDLPLSRWRVRGELAEVRAADLRFTSDEAATYLNEVAGLDLASEDVAALEERTEGWIAALQLAALSIQGRDDVSGFISRFAGNDRYIVDYLVEEVLRHQTEPVRDFLLRSAVLDRLTGPLCDAVTDRDDGSRMLMALERANLFLVALDDRREWYRYHHLFADVLRARVLAEQPDLVPPLHRRASQWYERHDLAEEAVRHALAARDFDRATYLMELSVPAIRRDRQETMLLGWLKALPDDAVRRSPVLSVFYGYMLMVFGDLDAVAPRLDDAERALAAVPDGSAPRWAETEELSTLPATIAVHRASLAQARGDVAGTAEHARHALDLAGPTDHLARGGAAGFLGLAAWARGDVSSALETFTQAVASLHTAGALVDELSGTVVLADMWLAAGRPGTARRLYQRALRVAETHGQPVARATADLHVGISEIDREAGDLDAARRHLEAAAALGERAPMTESRYRWFVAMGRVADADGDLQEAITLLDKAEELYRPGFFPDVRPVAAMRARIWISRGNLSQAVDWARERGVSTTDDADYLREFDHLTLVRLLIAQYRAHPGIGALDQAARLLDRLHEAAETSGRAGNLLEIRMLQALAHDARGHRPQALESLARAWAQAPEPDEYVRLFLDEGVPMAGLLRDATHHGGAGGHARRLLRLGLGAPAEAEAPGSGRRPAPSAESLSDRELQVLRLLDSALTGPQIARELFVSHNTLRTHTKHIFTKLDVTSRRAAVLRARERGLM